MQIKHYLRRWGAVWAAVAAIFCLHFSAAAEDFPSALSIKAILPDNQISDVSYFDLRLSPGERQTVQLQITNAEDRPVEVTVELNPASTGLGGTIVYTDTYSRDESLRFSINEIAKVRTPVVEIPAKTSTMVDIEIDMADEAMDGVILGGLRVTSAYPQDVSETAETSQGEGLQINNRYAYVVGLKLTQNDTVVEPDFHLLDIRPELVNYSTSIVLNIQNSEAAIAKNMPFSAQVFEKGSSVVLREFVKDNAEMAPNSNCNYVVDWGNSRIQPGTYRILARMQHGERIWEWDEEFTITADDANSVNSDALGLEGGIPIWVYVAGGILLLILLIVLVFILGRRSSKKERRP